MTTFGPIRTALFVPGNRPDRVNKALHSGADAVIVDLEDAVPLGQKEETRAKVRELDGKFIDYPVVERARRTLELAKIMKK